MLDKLILGLLREERSGYDLKLLLQNRFPHVWKAELAQIYPLLQRLESEGLIVGRAGKSKAGPGRKLLKRTTAGQQRVRDWLASTEPRVMFDRNPLFIHLLIAGREMGHADFQKLIAKVEEGFLALKNTAQTATPEDADEAECWLGQLAEARAEAGAAACAGFPGGGAQHKKKPKSPKRLSEAKPARTRTQTPPSEPDDFIGRFD